MVGKDRQWNSFFSNFQNKFEMFHPTNINARVTDLEQFSMKQKVCIILWNIAKFTEVWPSHVPLQKGIYGWYVCHDDFPSESLIPEAATTERIENQRSIIDAQRQKQRQMALAMIDETHTQTPSLARQAEVPLQQQLRSAATVDGSCKRTIALIEEVDDDGPVKTQKLSEDLLELSTISSVDSEAATVEKAREAKRIVQSPNKQLESNYQAWINMQKMML